MPLHLPALTSCFRGRQQAFAPEQGSEHAFSGTYNQVMDSERECRVLQRRILRAGFRCKSIWHTCKQPGSKHPHAHVSEA